jgi:CRISPR-associated protein Cmr5
MQQKIEKLIPHAFKAVAEHLVKNGGISRQYNGYVAAFGASVIQSGLVAAVVFNSQDKSGAEKDRRQLMATILAVLKRQRGELSDQPETLLQYVQNPLAETRRLKQEILNAATAIKLVIRTYPLLAERSTENPQSNE